VIESRLAGDRLALRYVATGVRRLRIAKSDAEIRRCLKRYIARELYRGLNTTMAT
jgi:hypothetical protein